jgi:hypothetical protein
MIVCERRSPSTFTFRAHISLQESACDHGQETSVYVWDLLQDSRQDGGLGGYCFSPMFNQRKESARDQRLVQTNTTIRTRKAHGTLNVESAKQFPPPRFDDPSCDATLTVTRTIAKEM